MVIGFLHGAYFEGEDIGNLVAKCVKRSGCHTLRHVAQVTNARPYKI